MLLGPNVSIYAATHPIDVAQRQTGLELAFPVTIGDDAWIGGGSVPQRAAKDTDRADPRRSLYDRRGHHSRRGRRGDGQHRAVRGRWRRARPRYQASAATRGRVYGQLSSVAVQTVELSRRDDAQVLAGARQVFAMTGRALVGCER